MGETIRCVGGPLDTWQVDATTHALLGPSWVAATDRRDPDGRRERRFGRYELMQEDGFATYVWFPDPEDQL